MKKYFLLGLGLLLTGSVLAATISTVTIDNKDSSDRVTSEEFNIITSGLNAITDMFDSSTSTASSIDVPKDLETNKLTAPTICFNDDCRVVWPSEGGTTITAKECPAGTQLQTVLADGTFTCATDETSAGGTTVNTSGCTGTQKLSNFDSGTGDFTCATDETSAGGTTVNTSACGANEKLYNFDSTTGDFTCATDETGTGGVTHTLTANKWCYSTDGTTVTCDRNAPSSGGCEDYQYHKCFNTDLYWYNSCDEIGTLKETCASGCTDGEIGGVCNGGGGCADMQYSQCDSSGEDIDWYDSCGVVTTEKDPCASGCLANEKDGACCDDYFKTMCDGTDLYSYDSCGTKGAMVQDCKTGCTNGAKACSSVTLPTVPAQVGTVSVEYPLGGYCLNIDGNAGCSMARLDWAAPNNGGSAIVSYIIKFTPLADPSPPGEHLDGFPPTSMINLDSFAALFQSIENPLYSTAYAVPGMASWSSVTSAFATSVAGLQTKLLAEDAVLDANFLADAGNSLYRTVDGSNSLYIVNVGNIPEGRWTAQVRAINKVGAGTYSNASGTLGLITPIPAPIGIEMMITISDY